MHEEWFQNLIRTTVKNKLTMSQYLQIAIFVFSQRDIIRILYLSYLDLFFVHLSVWACSFGIELVHLLLFVFHFRVLFFFFFHYPC